MRVLLLAVVASESAVIVGGSHLNGFPGLALVLLASAAWAAIVFPRVPSKRRVDPHPGAVAIAIGAAFAVAVAFAPRGSHDVWSYVMSGRTVSTYHASPYVHPPSDFPHDPFLGLVASGWEHARSVYGPLFTGVSAGLTRVAGTSVLRARLAFQGLAALSVVAALALIWRETRSSRALAFVGLHPAIVIAVVNGGHNDGLVGLAVLGGALLVARRRAYGAGFVLGLGILCKASGALGLLGVLVWTVGRDQPDGEGHERDWCFAAKIALAATLTTVAGYLPVGFVAVRAIGGAEQGNTRGSPWDLVATITHAPSGVMAAMVLALVAACAWWWRASIRPAITVTATLAAYLLGGAFVLPWYPGWAFPTAALERRSLPARLVAAHAAFLVAVYQFEPPAHPRLSGAWAVIRTGVIAVCAFGLLATFLAATRNGRISTTDVVLLE